MVGLFRRLRTRIEMRFPAVPVANGIATSNVAYNCTKHVEINFAGVILPMPVNDSDRRLTKANGLSAPMRSSNAQLDLLGLLGLLYKLSLKRAE